MRGRTWAVRGGAGALALLCAVGGAVGQKPGTGDGKSAAIVNGEAITLNQLETALRQQGPMAVAQPETERKRQQQVVLDALINEVLLRQFLKQYAAPIDTKELNQRMGELVTALKAQGKTLADFCRELNQSEEQVKARVATTVQWIAYARKNITDPQVEKYYLENKDLFDKVMVHAAEIMLHVPVQSGQPERERAKAQLAELRGKILANEIEFAQAAKQYSQGPTKDAGGDLNWFPHIHGILPESILQAAFSQKPNQISEVIESEDGLHLLKVIERKAGEPSDFSKIKEEVRLVCIEEMQQVILRQLRQEAQKAGQIKILLP
jgi:parvulin-like peptidyl-prolyl isomerase